MRISITSAVACAVLIGTAIAASPVVASPGGGGHGPGQPPRADCRAPGRDLAPVKAGAVGAGGQIDIEGSGRVRLQGSFMSWGRVSDMDVKVVDRAGDGMAKIGSRCVRFSRGPGQRGRVAVMSSPRGRVVIDGTDIRVEITGPGSLAIAVTGSGTGVLNGVGTFTVNNRGKMGWPLKPINLALAPTS